MASILCIWLDLCPAGVVFWANTGWEAQGLEKHGSCSGATLRIIKTLILQTVGRTVDGAQRQ